MSIYNQYSFSAAIASGEVVRVSVNNGIRVAAVTQAERVLGILPNIKKSCDSLIISSISKTFATVHQTIAQAAQRFGRNQLILPYWRFPRHFLLKMC